MSELFRTPAITTTALRRLGGPIRESLRVKNYDAAMAHVRDTLAEVNHEAAWCYETDPDLPHMAAYFATLHDTCAQIKAAPPQKQRSMVRQVLATIEKLLEHMAHHLARCVEESAPERHLGIDEVEHRQRKYGDPGKAAPAVKVFD